jgi:hypothetical protein
VTQEAQEMQMFAAFSTWSALTLQWKRTQKFMCAKRCSLKKTQKENRPQTCCNSCISCMPADLASGRDPQEPSLFCKMARFGHPLALTPDYSRLHPLVQDVLVVRPSHPEGDRRPRPVLFPMPSLMETTAMTPSELAERCQVLRTRWDEAEAIIRSTTDPAEGNAARDQLGHIDDAYLEIYDELTADWPADFKTRLKNVFCHRAPVAVMDDEQPGARWVHPCRARFLGGLGIEDGRVRR